MRDMIIFTIPPPFLNVHVPSVRKSIISFCSHTKNIRTQKLGNVRFLNGLW